MIKHPQTDRQLKAFASRPSHAVILAGPAGSGKLSLARELAQQLLELSPEQFDSYGYQRVIDHDQSISIDTVRELEHFFSLKVPGQGAYSRVVIIGDSQRLTIEAQNALLKTLEEPPSRSLIILTTSHEQALLPTIRSRAQLITVQRPDKAALQLHFHDHFTDEEVERAYNMSGGLAGLMHALLNDDEHVLLAAVGYARQLLSQPAYARLQLVDELVKQKEQLPNLVFVLQQMAHISLQTATEATAAKWQNVLEASYQAGEALQANAQPKLVLTNLMLQL